MNDNPLQGKVALVTGAGSGPGEATARALADAGRSVVCIDINGVAAERARREQANADTKSLALQCELRTAAARAWANASAYHATKWGLVGFGRGVGVEGRADGIRVATIIPGGMRTHFFDRFNEQGIPMPEQQNLQGPANVARVIVFATQV